MEEYQRQVEVYTSPHKPSDFLSLSQEIGQLVTSKDSAYGHAFHKTAEILKVMCPEGISPDKYQDLTIVTRIIEKCCRLMTMKDAFGESPYQDISGYGVIGLRKDREGK